MQTSVPELQGSEMILSSPKRRLQHGFIHAVLPLLVCLALLCLAVMAAQAEPALFVPGQILVKPRTTVKATEFAAKLNSHGGREREVITKLNVRLVTVAEASAEALLTQLRADPQIEFAERDYLAEAAFSPNDPQVLNGNEWHLAKIQAPEAWNSTAGGSNTIVAVLDSGVNAAHPDLLSRLVQGYDFVWGDPDPSDDFGHGTAVSGLIAAAGNNGIGVAGVAFNARVMPIKVMNSSGFAAYSAIAQGIRFAVDRGAQVINISITGTSASATLQDAINYAWNSNVVVVAAAGNNASNIPLYPAMCSNVVAVSASLADDSLAGFSSYGRHIALAAPGNAIWSTTRDLITGYSAWSGTSFASPVVAGVAALIVTARPALSSRQIVSILEQTADDVGEPGFDPLFGYGRVNAARAIDATQHGNFSSPVASVVSPSPGIGVSGQVNVEVAATASTAVARVECYANGMLVGTDARSNCTFTWLTAALTNGTYTLQAKAFDVDGNVGCSVGVEVNVLNTAATPATITSLTPTQTGTLQLTWSANPDKTYRVQYTTTLTPPTWQDCSGDVTATNTRASFTFHAGSLPQCFFRVLSLP